MRFGSIVDKSEWQSFIMSGHDKKSINNNAKLQYSECELCEVGVCCAYTQMFIHFMLYVSDFHH